MKSANPYFIKGVYKKIQSGKTFTRTDIVRPEFRQTAEGQAKKIAYALQARAISVKRRKTPSMLAYIFTRNTGL